MMKLSLSCNLTADQRTIKKNGYILTEQQNHKKLIIQNVF